MVISLFQRKRDGDFANPYTNRQKMKKVGELTSKTTGNKLPILVEGKRSYLDFSAIVGEDKMVRIDWKVSECGQKLYDTVHAGNYSFAGFVEPTGGFLLDILNSKKAAKKEENHFFSHIIGDGF